MPASLAIGTAGWSIPRAVTDCFPRDGSTLFRYAQRFPCVEIDTSFYRSHRPSTYARWRYSVPSDFRFAVKLPKVISHAKRLADVETEFRVFLDETSELGNCRGPLLLQLPPSFIFDPMAAGAFFELVRRVYSGDFVVEPRHSSWFAASVTTLLRQYSISVVIADPPPHGARPPDISSDLSYFRLHGSPRVYYSAYGDAQVRELQSRLTGIVGRCWVIFDNTASGAAARNALDLMAMIAGPSPASGSISARTTPFSNR